MYLSEKLDTHYSFTGVSYPILNFEKFLNFIFSKVIGDLGSLRENVSSVRNKKNT